MNFDEIKKVADDVPESGFTVLKIDVDIDASGYRDLLEKQEVGSSNLPTLTHATSTGS